jgi:hypothetical protein
MPVPRRRASAVSAVALGGAAAGAWLFLHSTADLAALLAVREVGMPNVPDVDPRLLDALFAPLVRQHADLPEVAELARAYEASAFARLAIDDADRARVRERLEAARALAPASGMARRLARAIAELSPR